MIILGLILLIIGFVAKIAIVWTIGIIVLVIGLAFLSARRGRPGCRWPPALLVTSRGRARRLTARRARCAMVTRQTRPGAGPAFQGPCRG